MKQTKMKQTKALLPAVLVLSLLLLSAFTPAATPQAQDSKPAPSSKAKPLDTTPITIRWAHTIGPAMPTFITAREMGFFAKENITVVETGLAGSGLVAEALAANNIDMGNGAPLTHPLATLKGARTRIVSGYENTFVDSTGRAWESVYVVVRSGEGIRKYADFKGKKVAVNDIGSMYNFALRARMVENNIDPDKDITIIPIPFPQMTGALLQKQVDIIIVFPDGYSQAKATGRIDLLGTHTSLLGNEMDYSSVVGVSDAFLDKNPDAVVRFLRAFLQARIWMHEDMAKNNGKNLLEIVARAQKFTPERATTFWETRGGWYGKEVGPMNILDFPPRLLARHVEILKAGGVLPAKTQAVYEKVVDIGPLKRAYETLGLKWDDSKHTRR